MVYDVRDANLREFPQQTLEDVLIKNSSIQ